MQHKTLEYQKNTIHYYISKKENFSNTLLFAHGLTADYSMFEKQVEYFKDKMNIILWDMPLHGKSKNCDFFSYNDNADIMYNILKEENINDVTLAGMSMGGWPCQFFAAKYHNMVSGFIAIDTTPLNYQYYSKLDIWLIKHISFFAKLFPENMLKKSMAKSMSKTKYSYEKMIDIYQNYTKADIIKQLDMYYKQFIIENKDISIKCPVILIAGEYDNTGKVLLYSKQWAKDIKSHLYIIKNAAHFSNADNYEEVNNIIEKFMKNKNTL
ncbi:alpha/beta fold hydrolase [Mucispirillum schaedleri]|uniref:alpha/beta fold hydrolase n=1 Tax=Mucispirillum schaedleri TaxID=248039 RepID=UPI001F5742D3|nr:alpha/beta hydrolase [Mucispirillum schaedleri]